MNTFYCKVEDSNKNQYILTDKFKQPLLCERTGFCIIHDLKRLAIDPEIIKNVIDYGPFNTKIPCTEDKDRVFASKPINKSNINFDIYDIATFNKDIVIKDYNDKQYTGKEIEEKYPNLFILDKDNKIIIDKMKQYDNVAKPPLNVISEIYTKMYDYNQQFLTKEEYNNCIISDWTPCNDTNRTRTRTRTQSTKIGTACTPDENNLPLTQTCNNCIISEWSSCDNTNRTRTRTRTQALNSTACTPDEDNLPLTQTCNNCIISEWSPCNNTDRTRTRTRTQALNSTACTPDEDNLPLTQTCNNCIISEWSPCDYTNFTQTRTRTEALNSTACTSDENNLPLTQTCSLSSIKIYIGIFVLLIFAIAFGFYIFKPKPNQPNYQYPNQQYPNY